MKQPTQSVSLVLGSGGARGLAHIGVIRWLEANGYRIESIAGSSIGALVGGVHAAGRLDEFEHWISAVTKFDILTLLDISWMKSGLIKGDKVINTLIELVGDVRIEDLPISYTAVAADIVAEKEVWIRTGRLFDAIRASMSLPMFFTPFHYRGVDLIDGGVLNPVPIAPTFGDETDLTIAVNLGGPPTATPTPAPDNRKKTEPAPGLRAQISQFLERIQNGRATDAPSENWDAYDVANQAFDAMQGTIARQKLAAYPPEILIEVPRNACATLEFDRAREMIELGHNLAEARLNNLKGAQR